MFGKKSNKLFQEKKLSLWEKKFICEKKNLIYILNICANKILFPKEFIFDIKCVKDKLYILLNYVKGYNITIIKSRQLLKKLEKVSSWGYIFNSYDSWNVVVYNILVQIKKYSMLILHFVQNKEMLMKKIFELEFVYDDWFNKLIVFMYLRKNSNTSETNFICVKDFGKINLINYYTLEQVEKLLPVLSNSTQMKGKIKYYPITDLYLCSM